MKTEVLVQGSWLNQPENKRNLGIGAGVICLVLIVVISVAASSDSAGEANEDSGVCNTDLNVIANVDEYVKIIFTECPSNEAERAFLSAASRLSDAVGQTQNFATGGQDLRFSELCGDLLQNDPVVTLNGNLDGLVIAAEVIDIDGAGGVLAQAGPCAIFPQTGLPVLGLMQFDNADLEVLEEDGTLEAVILHEMLHVLGLGTLWGNLLNDPVFIRNNAGQLIDVVSSADPKFSGASAVSEFNALGGNGNVPVENGVLNGNRFFDVERGEGQGSVDGHWRIENFDNELMVFSINPNDDHPLSRMSLASLRDVGYTVNLNVADDFSLNSIRKTNKIKKLRAEGEDETVTSAHDLSGDRLEIPIRSVGVDANGVIVF